MNTDIQRAQSALQYLDAHDRQEWYQAAMMLKSEFGDAVFDIWNEWSQQADSYNATDARHVWKSCKPSGGLSIGSLFYKAKQSGWQDSTEYTRPSPAELAQRALRRQLERQQAEAEQQQRHAAIAVKAARIWSTAAPANPEHPYLIAKQIERLRLRQINDALMVPIVNGTGLVNLQFIQPDGGKRFLTGGQVAGACAVIGQPSDTLRICEGYATGATIHQLTGDAVLCALSASNLMAIARSARAQLPSSHIVICADNDHQTPGNPGVTAARNAAAAIGAELMIPSFPDGHHGSDWNDYYLMEQAEGAI